MKHYINNNTTEKFIYTDFVRDLRDTKDVPYIHYPSEYNGQEVVKLCCTQHQMVSESEQRKITAQWADFLSQNPLPLKEVQLCTITPQRIFNALCAQSGIESLRIKWLRCTDLSAITGLKHLKRLFIESGSSLTNISPLSSLEELEVLILGETMKLRDYSPIGDIKSLKTLGVCRYQSAYDSRKMKMQSDEFLAGLPALRYLDLRDIVIENRSFLTPESVSGFDFASFPASEEN